MVGWQWVFIFWGIPAVILGFLIAVLSWPTGRAGPWLTDEECAALEDDPGPRKAGAEAAAIAPHEHSARP